MLVNTSGSVSVISTMDADADLRRQCNTCSAGWERRVFRCVVGSDRLGRQLELQVKAGLQPSHGPCASKGAATCSSICIFQL
jgi:hypothetical protein